MIQFPYSDRKGEMSFSVNGHSGAPNGIAFQNLKEQFVPAIYGYGSKIQVNFRQRLLKFEPPQIDFKSPW